jgi:hypothetical protein
VWEDVMGWTVQRVSFGSLDPPLRPLVTLIERPGFPFPC